MNHGAFVYRLGQWVFSPLRAVRLRYALPSFVSVDVEKAWCRKPCERMVRVQQNCNAQVSTITTYLYPVRGFTENTGRMAAMSEVLLLTNSIDMVLYKNTFCFGCMTTLSDA